ncbi:MAG TPA: flagellar basal-body MS-ring/collar protein FliF [bacterium]|nr:flagellar basal-body MS-ring/collar protein FliF [bacterium]
MEQIFTQIAQLFKKYSPGQRILIVMVFVGIVSAIIALLLWANRPEYELLHSELPPNKASKIVNELRDKNIKYKIQDNGTTIKVPRENVDELRLEFAEKGYLGEDIKGYKVFDESKIGMTTFMQRLNMKRALEGELSKTIDKFAEVKSSRVHLVMPKEKLFEEKARGKASVVLYLNNGNYLNDNQVKGIASLVANSVEGIQSSDVAVLDSDGNLLSGSKEDENDVLSASGNQWNLRHQVEQKLRNKVSGLVEGVVGQGNAKVQVSAELNMEKLEETIEKVDPENLAVVSEERQIESQTSMDTLNNTNQKHSSENVITNYETNKTVRHHVHSTGDIKRLSVAVLVDGTYQDNSDEGQQYVPRNQQEINQITQLVKGAVGFDPERGDVVEVKNLQFSRTQLQQDREYFKEQERQNLISNIINKGLIVVGILVAFFLIRSMIKRSPDILEISASSETAALKAGDEKYLAAESEEEDDDIDEDQFIKKLTPEARAKLKAKRKMLDSVEGFVEEKPEEAAQMLRTWIHDT